MMLLTASIIFIGQETFSRMVYVQPYSDSAYTEQVAAYQRAKEVVVSTKKVSLAEVIIQMRCIFIRILS